MRSKITQEDAEIVAKRKLIADRVKQLLTDRGWSQKLLAERAHITEPHLSLFLKKAKNINLDTILAIEKAFGEPIIHVTGATGKH